MQFNELTLRTRIFVISGIIGAILVIVLIAVAVGGSGNADSPAKNIDETPVNGNPAILPPEAIETIKQEAVRNPVILVHSFARSFAERLGSFSNEADFENMSDLTFFMTARMQTWAKETIAKERQKQAGSDAKGYYGIVTRALAVTNDALDMQKGAGSLTVSTQRRETRGDVVRAYQEDLYMELERIGTDWKVDGAEWVEHREDVE